MRLTMINISKPAEQAWERERKSQTKVEFRFQVETSNLNVPIITKRLVYKFLNENGMCLVW